jgi:cysteine-rich repeat protein
MLALLLSGCHASSIGDSAAWKAPGCGDGVVEDGEACDDGPSNSDVAGDACRSDCSLARCGDGTIDANETCDDGNTAGGDGCTPWCAEETGQAESEPNDDDASATALTAGTVFGSLPDEDVDCFAFALESCGALAARQLAPCDEQIAFTLFDPSGAQVAIGTPGADGCGILDPSEAAGASQALPGDFALCIAPWTDPVAGYAATIEPLDFDAAGVDASPTIDLDFDGRANTCDLDIDGDGIDDDEDNCPFAPNALGMPAPRPTPTDGYLRAWLSAGPFVGTKSADQCLPSGDDLVAAPDAAAQPSLGGDAGDLQWTALWSALDRIEYLTDYGKAPAPREVYNAIYVYSATTRDADLAVGPDDGIRAWWDGNVVIDLASCQGTIPDFATAPVAMTAGWHTLLLKVRDQGGGWGNYARFLDAEGEPITDLELSMTPSPWIDDQTDSDHDGVGDACDPTPTG